MSRPHNNGRTAQGVARLVRAWAVPLTAWAGLALGLFWTSGLTLDAALAYNDPWAPAVASALAAALPTLLPRLRRPDHLALSPAVPLWRSGLLFLILCPACWLCLTLPAWALARVLLATTWPDPSHPDAGLFVSIVTTWLPLWWAPGAAALLVGWRHRVRRAA